MPELPSDAQFLDLIRAEDYLPAIIRGHQAIEAALDGALTEALPAPHALEITRLSFLLKTDIAVALNILREDSRPTLAALNRLRNQFAHRPTASYGAPEALELANSLSSYQLQLLGISRETLTDPRSAFEWTLCVSYIEATAAIKRLQEKKLADEALHELVVETLNRPNQARTPEDISAVNRRLQKKIELKRTSGRGKQGA